MSREPQTAVDPRKPTVRVRPDRLANRPSLRLASLLTLALVAAACGGGGGAGVTATPLTSAQHAKRLAEGESAALAAELVEVSGYFYEDVSDEELHRDLGELSRGGMQPLAASFHVVRPLPSGDEVAFLMLFALDPNDAIHAPANQKLFARSFSGMDDIRRVELSGQTVFFGEDPSAPASRYKYVWLRHGTAGWADGPDQASVDAWLKAYFAGEVVLPGENSALVERLVRVAGFAYTNDTRAEVVQPFTSQAFAGSGYSIHHVFDKTHMFGTIVLIGPAPSLSENDFVAGIASSLAGLNGVRPVEITGLKLGSETVHRLISDGSGERLTTFVWWWADAGIGGALATERPDIGEPFLRAFLATQTS